MGQPVTFGKRYNLTGDDYYSDEGYVDTIAEICGASPEKVFVPASVSTKRSEPNTTISTPSDMGSVPRATHSAPPSTLTLTVSLLVSAKSEPLTWCVRLTLSEA